LLHEHAEEHDSMSDRASRFGFIIGFIIVVSVMCVTGQESDRHIRTTERELEELVVKGTERSASFRTLIDRLEQTNLIVYLQCEAATSTHFGRLIFVSNAGGRRYVVIRVRCPLVEYQQVALLGHELQHAVEVGEAADIVDQRTLITYYQQVGFRARDGAGASLAFETEAARAMEMAVRREILSGVVPTTVVSQTPTRRGGATAQEQ
jgi:hypothetical protein